MIDPAGIPMLQWSDAMALDLDRHGAVFRLDREDDWREWASYVVSLPGVNTCDPPLPEGFSTFRAWAQRFVGAYQTVV